MRSEPDLKWPLKFLFWAHVTLLALVALALLVGLIWIIVPHLSFGGTDELKEMQTSIVRMEKKVDALAGRQTSAQPSTKDMKTQICEMRRILVKLAEKQAIDVKGDTSGCP